MRLRHLVTHEFVTEHSRPNIKSPTSDSAFESNQANQVVTVTGTQIMHSNIALGAIRARVLRRIPA